MAVEEKVPEPVAPPKDEKKAKPVAAAPTKEKSPVIFLLRNGGEFLTTFGHAFYYPCVVYSDLWSQRYSTLELLILQ